MYVYVDYVYMGVGGDDFWSFSMYKFYLLEDKYYCYYLCFCFVVQQGFIFLGFIVNKKVVVIIIVVFLNLYWFLVCLFLFL